MRVDRLFGVVLAAVVAFMGMPRNTTADDQPFLTLVAAEKARATIVVPADEAPLWNVAAGLIADKCKTWGGSTPQIVRLTKDDTLPSGDLILLGTPETSRAISARSQAADSVVSRVPFTAPDGFAVESRTVDGSKQLLLAGHSPRGVYNAACWCRDFLLDATHADAGKSDVYVRAASLVRSPQIPVRGTYHLSIYGAMPQYTAEDWMKIVDRYAEDGMNRVCFWLSGHHPSTKHPQAYSLKNSKLSVDGVTRLIRHCHDRGIEFYIGGGVFAWEGAGLLMMGDHQQAAAVKSGGLCPSNDYARLATREHYLEMYQSWPEADGFMFEIRDEQGECQCEKCQVKLDEFGSKAYGQAEISWLQEFARAAWEKNPKLKFCWLIGYAEHAHDINYYDQIRHMSDPRLEWLDARVGLDPEGPWLLPGPGGAKQPIAFFSRQVSHFDQFYKQPLERTARYAQRIRSEGLYGYIPAFEPGFATGSYYMEDIPLPVDILPYCLTGLVYRETTWEPAITAAELNERIQRRFFSPDAPPRLAADLRYLHQFSIENAELIKSFAKGKLGFNSETIAPLGIRTELERVKATANPEAQKAEANRVLANFRRLAAVQGHLTKMSEIEAHAAQVSATATPKTLEGLALMHRMVDDTRKMYAVAVPDPAMLSAAIAELSAGMK